MSEPLIRLPPLISHLSCVFIGLILSYYLRSDTTKPECFLPGKIFVAFPDSFFAKGMTKDLKEGRKVYFGKIGKSETFCLIKNTEAIIVQNEPFIVAAFPLKIGKILPDLLSRKNKGQMTLLPDSALNTVPSCIETKIEYGYEH